MNAVSGTRRAIKELVDGTIRVSVDVDPQHRKLFFELFSDIDMPVALAPLVPGFDKPQTESEKPKGGALARLAGQLCEDPSFHAWLEARFPAEWAREAPNTPTEDDAWIAARVVRRLCGVTSRAELDHNGHAASTFHESLRRPYHDYLSGK